MTEVLASAAEPQLEDRMQAALPLVQTLVERDPDLAIFQVIRQGAAEGGGYGARQAMQTAALAMMLATRLGWMGGMIDLAAKCALTMNLSILESMSPLFVQSDQKNHPELSRDILQNAGINDPDWLEAVEQHHERPDGPGYPRGVTEVTETSQLVQCVESFVEGLGRAAGHSAVTATGLLRQMYLEAPKSIFVAALIKELGVYPPGSVVRLSSGEFGVVIQRGATTTAPLVAVLDEDWGIPREPEIRDTSSASYAVIGVLPPRDGRQGASAAEVWDRAIAVMPKAVGAADQG
ncbi:MAG: HD-GYP domain-containing protein [Gammaproteobacteria bacterium]